MTTPQALGPQPLPGGAQAFTVQLNSSGAGVAQGGPIQVRQHWQVMACAVRVATNVAEASCSIYIGSSLATATFYGTTFTGSSGDTIPIGGMDIQPGQFIFAQWSGGDANATATLTVFGTYTTGAPSASFLSAVGQFFNRLVPVFRAGDLIINNSGIFLYNGTPKLGNPPFAWIKFMGTAVDPVGNVIQSASLLFVSVSGPGTAAINWIIASNFIEFEFQSGVASEQDPANFLITIRNPGSPTSERISLGLLGPESQSVPLDRAGIQLIGSSPAGHTPNIATGVLQYLGATTGLVQPPASNSAASLTTLNLSLGQATGTGNSVVVVVACGSSGDNPVTSGVTLGGVALVQTSNVGNHTDDCNVSQWIAAGAASGQTAIVVTAAGGTGAGKILATAYEFAGILASNPVDVTQTNQSDVTGLAWDTGAPGAGYTYPNDIVVGVVGAAHVSAPTLTVTSPGFSNTEVISGIIAMFSGWQSPNTNAGIDYAGTMTSNPGFSASQVAYRPAQPIGGQNRLSWGLARPTAYTLGGLNGPIALTLVDNVTRSATTNAIVPITLAYAIPAGDFLATNPVSTYTLECGGQLNAAAGGFGGDFFINFLNNGVNGLFSGFANGAFVANHTYNFYIRVTFQLLNATAFAVRGIMATYDATLVANPFTIPIFAASLPCNANVAGQIGLGWQWNGSAAGQFCTCQGSQLEIVGP